MAVGNRRRAGERRSSARCVDIDAGDSESGVPQGVRPAMEREVEGRSLAPKRGVAATGFMDGVGHSVGDFVHARQRDRELMDSAGGLQSLEIKGQTKKKKKGKRRKREENQPAQRASLRSFFFLFPLHFLPPGL